MCVSVHVLGDSRLSSNRVKEQICQRAPDSRITSIYEAAFYVSPQYTVPNCADSHSVGLLPFVSSAATGQIAA